MKLSTIIIPIYYENPTILDKLSISSLMNNLEDINDYDINFICPNMDTSKWKEITTKGKNVFFNTFDSSNFLSTQSYSHLLESYEFWNTFSKYEYVLIYQTDGYCVGGNLKTYIDMDYDYIGAPIIAQNARWFNVPAIGNGGISLRKTSTMIEVVDPNGEFIKESKEDIDKHNKANSNMYEIYEDLYFAQLVPMLWDFKKPKFDVATSFAYDMNADVVYEMTNHKLPLFIHAFDKNIRFWQNILNDFKDIDIISACEWKNKDGYLSNDIGYQENLQHIVPPSICAIMIVKNENHHLNEQISKLIDNGIKKVILIDNNDISKENPKDIVNSKYVEVISKFRGDHSTENRNMLSEAYKEAYGNYTKGFTHVLFIDADEELNDSTFNKIVYENKDYDIIKIPVVNVDINGNKSKYQQEKYHSIVKTGLNFKLFNREGPITYLNSVKINEYHLLNYITCKSRKEFDTYKLYRGYPDKEPILGKRLTDDRLYTKVNQMSSITLN